MNYDNYDTLLGISNPELRKQMGVWYTPKEIVTYMVKGVDQILSTYFHLSLQSDDVVLLDPATGTGTFISEVIKYGKTTNITAIEILEESYNIAQSKLPKTIKLIHGNTLELNEEAVMVRQEQPVMVVLGNPPYNGNSKNNGDFITELMSEYKDSSKNIGPGLNDDYIKFIRYGQSLIDQNGSGILAFITNNSFIKSLAAAKMRESLLGSFDEIYILNLHGDQDENVFNIKQPVCISFFVKTNKKAVDKLGKVFYHEIKGNKTGKISYCINQVLNEDFKEIPILGHEKYFIPQDVDTLNEYKLNSFSLDDLFSFKSSGIITRADSLVIDSNKTRLQAKINLFVNHQILPEKPSEHLQNFKVTSNLKGKYKNIPYRPFDNREYFDSKITSRRMEKAVSHEQVQGNMYLNFRPLSSGDDFNHILITRSTSETGILKGSGCTFTAPLYLHSPNVIDPSAPQFKSNLNTTITAKFTNLDSSITDLDIVDYIYGVLNDKAYTTKYNQFLKSNYPRVPYPKSIATFISYKDAGSKLRSVHLDDTTQDSKSTYNATTNNKIEKIFFDTDKVYFNKTSYFDNISQAMFDFKIGASQPLKNWLESRKEDSFDESMVEQFLNVIYKVRNSL